ncbi:hypothetical protein [Salsuginibacillus kocurii]|uniref:hypothetical protein n=1 Tax=Salsuginibacillus kocurii TaxID=427078 RepID=UPI00036CBA21|nr:hypothetical protein [Salsuginibacillus kocurii]
MSSQQKSFEMLVRKKLKKLGISPEDIELSVEDKARLRELIEGIIQDVEDFLKKEEEEKERKKFKKERETKK